MPFHMYIYYGKAWGRDLERNRWGWPHSLQAPMALTNCAMTADIPNLSHEVTKLVLLVPDSFGQVLHLKECAMQSVGEEAVAALGVFDLPYEAQQRGTRIRNEWYQGLRR